MDKELTEENARKFAEENFGKMPELENKWNIIHASCMVKAIEELTNNPRILDKLKPLAWVHDIGKIKSEENHGELSIEILNNSFNLDEIDKECILNHGSSGTPKSEEAKIFQTAAGLPGACQRSCGRNVWRPQCNEGL